MAERGAASVRVGGLIFHPDDWKEMKEELVNAHEVLGIPVHVNPRVPRSMIVCTDGNGNPVGTISLGAGDLPLEDLDGFGPLEG